jgi:hypothetical protein
MRHHTPAQPLGLAPHVRACESDGQVVLLDLQRSKYLGVLQSRALADRVRGWPASSETSEQTPMHSSGTGALLQRLMAQGVLTHSPDGRLSQTSVEEATSSLEMQHGVALPNIRAQEIGRFMQSASTAALWLRFRSLQSIATAVDGRRGRLQRNPAEPGSTAAMRGSVAIYERLRPFVFSAHQNCLFDSLALVGFLALHGFFPRWVIGVQTRPFAAHSWVQSGAVVLNDEHERVRRFRPILVV